jgi:hypothetical protein
MRMGRRSRVTMTMSAMTSDDADGDDDNDLTASYWHQFGHPFCGCLQALASGEYQQPWHPPVRHLQ